MPVLGRVRVELFYSYYITATDIVDRYKLRQIISYVYGIKRLELNSKSLDTNNRYTLLATSRLYTSGGFEELTLTGPIYSASISLLALLSATPGE